jgi:pimeloyl-CoA synthetase
MKFVKVLLETHSANKYIIKTKNIQKEVTNELYNDGGDPMFMNIHVNKIMGVILQMEDGKSVKKSEIYQFQNRITEDVGRVRDEVLKTYATMFKVTEDKEKTYELTLEWSKKKYLK